MSETSRSAPISALTDKIIIDATTPVFPDRRGQFQPATGQPAADVRVAQEAWRYVEGAAEKFGKRQARSRLSPMPVCDD